MLVFSNSYLAKEGGQSTVDGVLKAWDMAASQITKLPESYRPLLVEKAKVPASLASSYRINTYPNHQLPAQADVDPVLAWMQAKGYLKTNVTYDQLVGKAK